MTRLEQILPASIAAPPLADAAAVVGGVEEDIRAVIPTLALWSRLEELSEDLLDHLAWHLHIDGYAYARSKAEKLWLVQHFHLWHRHKGTVYGHALYWRRLLDRELLGHAPRYNSFCGSSLTAAERKTFEDRHPEIRIYPYRNRGEAHGMFCTAIATLAPEPWPVQSDAAERVGKQLYYYDPASGVEVKINRLTADESPVTIAVPGKGLGAFAGSLTGVGCTVDHLAASRLYTIYLTTPDAATTGSDSLAAQPLVPMYSNYSVTLEPGVLTGLCLGNRFTDDYADRGGCLLGGYFPQVDQRRKLFFAASDAADRVYKKLKLYDASRVSTGIRNARAFIGGFRLGKMEAHNGEIAVDTTGTANMAAAYPGGSFAGVGHFVVSDAGDRIKQIVDVGRLAARASDRIMLSVTNHSTAKVSTAYKSGNIKAGSYVLRVY